MSSVKQKRQINRILDYLNPEKEGKEMFQDIDWELEKERDPIRKLESSVSDLIKLAEIKRIRIWNLIKKFARKFNPAFSSIIKFIKTTKQQFVKQFVTMKKSPILNRVQNEAKTVQNEISTDIVRQQQKRFQTALKSYLNKNKEEELEVKPRKYFGGLYH